jgi:hypothetical protein
LGGALAQAFGWRGTFVSLAVLCVLMVALLAAAYPETHQWYVMRRLKASDPAAAAAIQRSTPLDDPVFQAPWRPLRYLFEAEVRAGASSRLPQPQPRLLRSAPQQPAPRTGCPPHPRPPPRPAASTPAQVGLHAAVACINCGVVFAALYALPGVVAHPPYSLSETIIGISFLPNGFGAFLASPLGGRLADACARRYEARGGCCTARP